MSNKNGKKTKTVKSDFTKEPTRQIITSNEYKWLLNSEIQVVLNGRWRNKVEV